MIFKLKKERTMAQERSAIFTNAEVNSYERSFTSMSFVWLDGKGLISLAPIFDEFVGKEPKKGDNMYDYDSKLNFLVDPQGAIRIRSAVKNILNADVKSVTVEFSPQMKSNRTLTIFKPGCIKLGGKNYENYILRLTTKKDDEEEKMYHIMQHDVVQYKLEDNTSEEETIEVDMLLLLEFCNTLIENSFNISMHGAVRASGRKQADSTSRHRSSKVVEEESDDGEGDDDAPPAKKSNKGNKSQTR